jgi:endoglucanase
MTGEAVSICGQFDTYGASGNEYIVQHNEWNSSVTECLNVSGTDFSVIQDGQHLSTSGPPASYPSIYKGCHWGNCTTNSGLPLVASDIGSATTSWSVNLSNAGSSVYDAAYDIWFNDSATTSGQPNDTEIMIWINHAGAIQPAGSIVGQLSAAGATWNVWYARMSSWNYVAYVRTSGTTSVNLDLLPFFQDSIGRGYTQQNSYLIDIEAGFEIWQGGTGLETTSFTANASSRESSGGSNVAAGYYELAAQFSGRCLDAVGWGTSDKTQIDQWDCGAGGNQQWYLNPTVGSFYQLINMNANKCLDVPGASTAPGTYLQLWGCNGTVAQNWMFVDTGGGVYEIVNQGSGLVIDVDQINPANGALIHQWNWVDGGNQRWTLLPLAQTVPTVTIRSNINGKFVCADNAGASPLIANRDAASTWESFYEVQATQTQVAFVSLANGLFVTADIANRGGQLIAGWATRPLGWELFTPVAEPDGQWALLSGANGMYVTAENAGASPLVANRAAVSTWELFWIE